MEEALPRHDAAIRAAIAIHGGFVFKTMGDAFCAAFARPESAVAAMLDAQRALATHDFVAVDGLPVRAAVHTGTADERDGDYFGPAVNRVARLLAIGHGGQVLVSGVTADLVQGSLPRKRRCAIWVNTACAISHGRNKSINSLRPISTPNSRRCGRSIFFRTTCRCSSRRSSVANEKLPRSPRYSKRTGS